LVFAGRSVTALLLAFALSAVVARPALAQDWSDGAAFDQAQNDRRAMT
jgi:hypothetical protein